MVEESYVMKKILRVVLSKFMQIASTLEQFGYLDRMTVEEVIGRLKAHEERMKGHGEIEEKKLLLTHEEWFERKKMQSESDSKNGSRNGSGSFRGCSDRGKGGSHQRRDGNYNTFSIRDKSTIQCYNCQDYRHYVAECMNLRRERNHESNIVQEDMEDEPTLFFTTLNACKEVSLLK